VAKLIAKHGRNGSLMKWRRGLWQLRETLAGGSQFVRVEHVYVNQGGQAVIGAIAVDRTQGAG
jgi:hypothetical protein